MLRRMASSRSTAEVLEIPPGTLGAARMTKAEVKLELAILLYSQGRLSFGKARELAGMNHWPFRHTLAARGVSPHYEPEDVDKDRAALDLVLGP